MLILSCDQLYGSIRWSIDLLYGKSKPDMLFLSFTTLEAETNSKLPTLNPTDDRLSILIQSKK